MLRRNPQVSQVIRYPVLASKNCNLDSHQGHRLVVDPSLRFSSKASSACRTSSSVSFLVLPEASPATRAPYSSVFITAPFDALETRSE